MDVRGRNVAGGRRITTEQEDIVIAAYAEGKPCKEIALLAEVSEPAIYMILSRRGIATHSSFPRRNLTQEDKGHILELYDRGVSVAEIARQINRSANTVSHFICRMKTAKPVPHMFGWPITKRKGCWYLQTATEDIRKVAPRYVYLHKWGWLPDKVKHICGNPHCVNDGHIYVEGYSDDDDN